MLQAPALFRAAPAAPTPAAPCSHANAQDLRAMAWEALLQNLGCDGGGTLDAALRATQVQGCT